MSSGCFISLFLCRPTRKRTVIPSENTDFTSKQSIISQFHRINQFKHSESLPKLPNRVSHRPTIMIKYGSFFQEQFAENLQNLKKNKITLEKMSKNSGRNTLDTIKKPEKSINVENDFSNPFLITKEKNLLKIDTKKPTISIKKAKKIEKS